MRTAGGTYRPFDWTPLAERDPVPGDPDAIRGEAAHMRRTAQALRDQARELRAIAASDGLVGAYADALRGEAADLDRHLRQTAERYEHVHTHLSDWAGELEDMQSESVALLRRAEAEAPPHAHLPPSGAPSGPGSPDDPVAPLRASLERLTVHRDDRAAVHAGRIRSACDDVIADSSWEHFEDAVSSVLDRAAIAKALEAASWAVTVVGIAALFLTPAGWIVNLALGLTLALAAKDVLALVAGDGSWFDIGMDVLGLLTAGTGKLAFTALSRIRSATRLAAQAAAEEHATAAAVEEARPDLDRAYRVTARRTASSAAKTSARQLRARLLAAADHAGTQARDAEAARPLLPAPRTRVIAFGGDGDAAALAEDIDGTEARWGVHEAVRRAAAQAEAWQAVYNASWRTAMGFDAVDKGLGSSDLMPMKPSVASYDRFKERCSSTLGTGW